MAQVDRTEKVAAALQKLEFYRKQKCITNYDVEKSSGCNYHHEIIEYKPNNLIIYQNSPSNTLLSQECNESLVEDFEDKKEFKDLEQTISTLLMEKNEFNSSILAFKETLEEERKCSKNNEIKIDKLFGEKLALINQIEKYDSEMKEKNELVKKLLYEKDALEMKATNIENKYQNLLQKLDDAQLTISSLTDKANIHQHDLERTKLEMSQHRYRNCHKITNSCTNFPITKAKFKKTPLKFNGKSFSQCLSSPSGNELYDNKALKKTLIDNGIQTEDAQITPPNNDKESEERTEGQKFMSRRQHLASLREKSENPDYINMETLEKVMEENVLHKKRIENLEHLIILLEGESDCIGEYIGIYHAQRDYLKKRGQTRDNYLIHIIQLQTEIKAKLVYLKELITSHYENINNHAYNSPATDHDNFPDKILTYIDSLIETAMDNSYQSSINLSTNAENSDDKFIVDNLLGIDEHAAACKCCQGFVKIL